MPSLWKKKKGNRISRLVADLQSTPKRGGSLVVETGFPTSLVDLFVKNRDKLKKPKTKKHKSKKAATVSEDDGGVVDEDDNDPLPTSVSNSSDSLPDLEQPTRSIGENCQENAAQIDNPDVFVEKHAAAHENHDAEFHNDSCNNEGNKAKREMVGVSNQRNVILLSILMGALMLIVVLLYTKRWFLAFTTLGFLLLFLLRCVGNPVLKLFKPCENVISMPVLKGGLAVVVALYTKWFIVGITMGASLLLLMEYAGNSGFGLFKPCQDTQSRLQGFLSQLGAFKRRRMCDQSDGRGRGRGRGVLTRSGLIGSKREARKEGGDDAFSRVDFDQEEVGDGAMSRKEVEPQLGNDLTSKMGTNLSFEDGDVVAPKGMIEQQSGSSTYVNDSSLLHEEDSRNKPMYELLALESKNSKSLRRRPNISGVVGYVDLQVEKGAIEGRQKGSEDPNIVDRNGKNKKGKKFWKKLVPKKKSKKENKNDKHEHGKECDATNSDYIHDAEVELEEEDEVEEGEQDISDGEGSSVLSSYEEDEEGVDNVSASYGEMSEFDNRTTACGTIKEKDGNPKNLVIMMIPLTGLIGGRLFAVVLTIICCLVFKMVRA